MKQRVWQLALLLGLILTPTGVMTGSGWLVLTGIATLVIGLIITQET